MGRSRLSTQLQATELSTESLLFPHLANYWANAGNVSARQQEYASMSGIVRAAGRSMPAALSVPTASGSSMSGRVELPGELPDSLPLRYGDPRRTWGGLHLLDGGSYEQSRQSAD